MPFFSYPALAQPRSTSLHLSSGYNIAAFDTHNTQCKVKRAHKEVWSKRRAAGSVCTKWRAHSRGCQLPPGECQKSLTFSASVRFITSEYNASNWVFTGWGGIKILSASNSAGTSLTLLSCENWFSEVKKYLRLRWWVMQEGGSRCSGQSVYFWTAILWSGKNINIDLLPGPSPEEITEANNIFELWAVLARASRGPQARFYS